MGQRIIDFHTHAFPDSLAPRAMNALLSEAPGVKAYLDGTMKSLLDSMDRSGIEKSVVCCIATKPEQFESIFTWCKQVRSERLVMIPSIHPAEDCCLDQIDQIKAAGFKGIKMHPFYQDFFIDEDRMLVIYEKLEKEGMMVVMHTGFDIAFPRIRRADPEKIIRIHEFFPRLKFISTHFGAWEQWDEVEKLIIGKPIYMEISFALEYLTQDKARGMILNHPADYILFGTDSPWTDQATTLRLLEDLMLPEDKLNLILNINAERLLA